MIKLNLPKPISTNALFANVRGKGRVKSARYNTWTCHAAAMLADQRPLPRIDYPCRVLFAVGEIGMRANSDGDNTLKCLLDALVDNGVLSDDNRKIVRGVGMEWVAGKEGVTAHIVACDSPVNDQSRPEGRP